MAARRKKDTLGPGEAAAATAKSVTASINKELEITLNGAVRSKTDNRPPSLDTTARSSNTKKTTPGKAPASLWYGGSWRSKASPVAGLARESISVSGGATCSSPVDTHEEAGVGSGDAKSPRPLMKQGMQQSSKSGALVAEATRVNVEGKTTDSDGPGDEGPLTSLETKTGTAPADAPGEALVRHDKATQNAATWFGWWSRPDGYPSSEAGETRSPKRKRSQPPTAAAVFSRELSPNRTASARTQSPAPTVISSRPPVEGHQAETLEVADKPSRNTASRSWFGLWSASQNQQAQQDPQATPTSPAVEPTLNPFVAAGTGRPRTPVTLSRPDAAQNDRPKTPVSVTKLTATDSRTPTSMSTPKVAERRATVTSTDVGSARQSTGWAFWSSDKPKDQHMQADGPQKHLGELAVADTPSQSHPEAAQFNEQGRSNSKQRRAEPARIIADKSGRSTASLTNLIEASAVMSDRDKPRSEAARLTIATQALKSKLKGPPNHTLPAFLSTYPQAPVHSYFEKFTQYLASSLPFTSTTATTPNHVCIALSPPKIRNAIAIGVHGYFPASIISKVIGQPTGTSIRFANYAADAVRWWVNQHQPESAETCEVEQIALEGEGLIADRVTTLWKLLLNWLSHLRKADLILVACHSQGVPVSVMLIAKLVELGCLGPDVRIGICAMAGINLGPFLDYKSSFFGAMATELFEFAKPESAVSSEYASSLDVILRHGVRVTYIGSFDDQLVSLESSLFINLSHPYVQRAVFIDGRYHAPDFIAHLVAFALKLRNLGISDHGLIRELSFPLAGSIYSGEGHSRVYDDEAVYQLALEFTLNTTDIDPKTYVSKSGAVQTHKDKTDVLSKLGGSGSDGAEDKKGERRKSQGNGIPASTSIANNIRRGNTSASQRPGIAPQIASYESHASTANANPYFLPWAMRGILEEPEVKNNMRDSVDHLIKLFDEWKPTTKPLKDIRFRLEAVKRRA